MPDVVLQLKFREGLLPPEGRQEGCRLSAILHSQTLYLFWLRVGLRGQLLASMQLTNRMLPF